MANAVKIRFRQFLPGGGFDSDGDPKQGKQRVIGEVDVTSYSGGSGEPFVAQDLGLTVIDSIQLRVADENTGDLSAAAAGGAAPVRCVTYAKSTGHFYLYTATSDEWVPVVTAATETLEFEAFGDSAGDVELTTVRS